MALNFPNNPIEGSTYLDPNGKRWTFSSGYWQEDIIGFSIDLLRDVKLADPVAIDSVLVWKDPEWESELLTYSTADIIGLDLEIAVFDDVMIWETDKFVPDSKENHTLYDIYDNVEICQIGCVAHGATLTNCSTWYAMNYDTTEIDSTGTQADIANNRIICQSNGIYEIGQFSYADDEVADSYINEFTFDFIIYTSLGAIKYKYNQTGANVNSSIPTYTSSYTMDYVELAVGDYLTYRLKRWQRISCRSQNITHHRSTMYIKKISSVIV